MMSQKKLMAKELLQVTIESAQELRRWLNRNHGLESSVWVVTWKKNSGHPHVTYEEIVDQCLCFGWVDSLPRKLDALRMMRRISPRSRLSNWSSSNKLRVKRLIKVGLMKPAGLAAIRHAKQSGKWNFLDDVEELKIPADLNQQFKLYPCARQLFERFPPSSRRGILEWIKNAKTDVTRHKRIVETARKAARNFKANHPKGRDRGPRLNQLKPKR